MGWMTIAGGIGMSCGPPMVYMDQLRNIIRTGNSTGFSSDVTGVLIFANITRCFYWLGARFQTALLAQSLLMILAQLALLHACLKYRPTFPTAAVVDSRSSQETDAFVRGNTSEPEIISPSSSASRTYFRRPYKLWQWASFGSYIEAVACLIAVQCVFYLIFHSIPGFVETLGFIALGSEAILPIPQLLTNAERKSTAGFRHSVLAGWLGGDLFKTVYFFVTENNGPAFKICAVFQLSIDALLLGQTWMYREKTRQDLRSYDALREEAGSAGVLTTGGHLRDEQDRAEHCKSPSNLYDTR